jgi:hypothetical protein
VQEKYSTRCRPVKNRVRALRRIFCSAIADIVGGCL